MAILTADLGTLSNGTPIQGFTLQRGGLTARFASVGGTLLGLDVPDRNGSLADVVLGDPDPAALEHRGACFGRLVGRCANRISGARFDLDGQTFVLVANEGPNQLHGGPDGFDRRPWSCEAREEADADVLRLQLRSPHGDQGYPGTVDTQVEYRLTETAELVIDYRATTDRPTLVNLTHHAYFNLSGHDSGDISGHTLGLHAREFAPVGPGTLPRGTLEPVAGSPFDFRTPKSLGAALDEAHPQLEAGAGFDHSFAVEGTAGTLRPAALVRDTHTGRSMEMLTTAPAVQLYTGNHLAGTPGKGQIRYAARAGLCLEAQHFPNAIHCPAFSSPILRPGDLYRQTTVYRFGTDERFS